MEPKNLPLGIQDFQDFKEGNYIYVDKTEYIYNLVKTYKGFYFFSRPRRFGKSLLISTLQYLFEGRRELFEGLWIDQESPYAWEPHPVVKIDFSKMNNSCPEKLEKDILKRLSEILQDHDIKSNGDSIAMKAANLITGLKKKYDSTVAVLIDEYDKPIITHLGKGKEALEIADKNRSVLKQLFGVLKESDVSGALRFIFLTGVSKFARVSVFSDLNNLNDLTMLPKYASLLGYSTDELKNYFAACIEEFTDELGIPREECLKRMKFWYNGYRFTQKDEKVYNPFSILNVLENRIFKNYWFETGTPSFLVNLIKERSYPVPIMEQLEIRESAFSQYEIEDLSLEALLFQTGYLTIKGRVGRLFRLGYPNQEVKNSFTDYLYDKMVKTRDPNIKNKFTYLADYLDEERIEEFIETVNIILSSITYHQISGQDEPYFHTVFYLMLSASGVEIQTEILTSRGRIDIAVFYPDKIFIIELKCNLSAQEALRQIQKMEYSKKYASEGKRIILMGINFDTDKREAVEWETLEL